MAEPEIIENFYGVYLLYNINPKYKGRTYIGYTRDPNRRIMQHNRGTWAGGAHRTSNRGPWKMVMVVHGFPNNISALRFEWAWQNPNKTTRLQHLNLKKIPRKESEYQFKFRVLSEMLRVGPWCRLPLMIRWLESEYRQEFPSETKPPEHMLVIQGPVKSYNRKNAKDTISIPTVECLLCSGYLKVTEKLCCTNNNCNLVSHINCLANLFLPPGEYIPINGRCPFCNTKLKWGDLIKIMKGHGQVDKDNQTDAEENDEICSQDKDFNDDDMDDEICTQINLQNYNNMVSPKNKKRLFIDNLEEDDDVICTQYRIDDFDHGDDVVCTQEDFNNVDDILNQRRVSDNYKEKVVCIQNENEDINKISDESDNDDILFKCNKVYDDQPSWFLDCNENL